MLTWFYNDVKLPLPVFGDSAEVRTSWTLVSPTLLPSQQLPWPTGRGSQPWLASPAITDITAGTCSSWIQWGCRAECWKWMSFSGPHPQNPFFSVHYPPGVKSELSLLRWKPFKRHNQSPKSKMLRMNLFCSQKGTHMWAFPGWIILSSSLSP